MESYMGIDREILLRHLSAAYLEQLQKDYSENGYSTSVDQEVSPGIRADFVARKNDEVVVYEIKAGPLSTAKREAVARLREHIRRAGSNASLQLALITPPPERHIDWDGIGSLILQDFHAQPTPEELDELSTHTTVDEITDIEINSLSVTDENVFVSGTGMVGVELTFGSDSDDRRGDGAGWADSYPFTFHLTFSRSLSLEESQYYIETDSYYE
jgi:hypothetical protein